jgi:lactoylglutathione lyase
MKALFRSAIPYADDALDLPVADVESAIPYYERVFGFHLVERRSDPHPVALMARDDIRIGFVENGRDPTQEGCFFEIDDVAMAHAELQASGANPGIIDEQKVNGKAYRAFFVVAPDGLCYMIAQPREPRSKSAA